MNNNNKKKTKTKTGLVLVDFSTILVKTKMYSMTWTVINGDVINTTCLFHFFFGVVEEGILKVLAY